MRNIREKISQTGQNISKGLHCFHMTVSDNREVLLEGSRGVIEYNENSVKINTGRYIVAFSGRGMKLSCMNEYNLMISGFITSIEYIM